MKRTTGYTILAIIALGIIGADVIIYGWQSLLSWCIVIGIPGLIILAIYLIFSVIYYFNQ